MGLEPMRCCGALTHVYADQGNRQHKPGCPKVEPTCAAQTYWYEHGVQRARYCDQPATTITEALDGSRLHACAEHARQAVEAGATEVQR